MGSRPGRGVWLLAVAGLFVLGFAARSLHAADLAPVLDTPWQPGLQMTRHYDVQAVDVLNGDGMLFPRVPDAGDTGPLARPPGYALLLAGIYRIVGRGLATTQLVQNLFCSLTGPLVLWLGAAVLSFRAGLLAGAFAALAPHLAWYSNWIVPDAPCVLLVLLALVLSWHGLPRASLLWQVAAGACLGAGVWLRPNLLLLGAGVGLGIVAARPGADGLKRAVVLCAASSLVVLPITARNYAVYGRFVPVSINLGIVLWEGIADAGGERFGAVRTDNEVARQEARLHGEPRHRRWWASPDGIERDRERIRNSLAVIRENPGWFARTMLARMARMLDYAGESPPVAGRPQATAPPDRPSLAPPSERWNAAGRTRGLEPRLSREVSLAPGERLAWLRPAVGLAQSALSASLTGATLLGMLLVGVAAPRRSAFLASVPLSFLLLQSPLHLEYRVTLPMHAVLFLFAASGWLMALSATRHIMRAAPWTSRSPAPTATSSSSRPTPSSASSAAPTRSSEGPPTSR
ncbi:MAG TPA: glycosyltransferase family 39 protein [Vicinamibacteria bacterium]|nr:glycosyltransferase family 39 protein [Vicinamibacteria bacterium]